MWLYLISGAVLLVAAGLLAYPLVFQQVERYGTDGRHSTPFSERDALLQAMSELELEFQGGKVAESDYRAHKARYEREYLAVGKAEPGGE